MAASVRSMVHICYCFHFRNTLKHINTTGNPMLQGDCRNAWLLNWREDSRRRRREAWREEEQTKEGVEQEVTGKRELWEQQNVTANMTAPPEGGPLHECPLPGSNSSSSCCELEAMLYISFRYTDSEAKNTRMLPHAV